MPISSGAGVNAPYRTREMRRRLLLMSNPETKRMTRMDGWEF